MVLRVAKVKRFDPGRPLVPLRKSLRGSGDVLDLVLPQVLVSLVHISHDDRDVLKPAIVAARVGRRRTASRDQELSELNTFVSQLQPRDARP